MIRIAIAEDLERIAKTLKSKIELSGDFKVGLMAVNGKDLIQQLQKDHRIDIILMDINMPVMDGVEATRLVCEKWPSIRVIMSTVFDDENHIFEAIRAGACGYLLKDESPEALFRALYEVMEDGAPMSPGIARKALGFIRQNPGFTPGESSTKDYQLTKREKEILEHLATGLGYDQIAHNLFISNGTVRKHIEHIYRKLQVHSKVEAVMKAQRDRLI